MASVFLVSDTRERSVHGFIADAFTSAGVEHRVSQINTGDYLICRQYAGGPAEIVACIERKTLKDFAASFRDGRYQNVEKMLDLRAKTGCQLYFYVEGPAYPKPTWRVSRTPYSSILAAMTNMMVRDGIFVVQTENEAGSAQRLLDFVKSFEKIGSPHAPAAPAAPATPAAPTAPTASAASAAPAACGGDDLDLVAGAVQKSNNLLAAEAWAQLAGISLPTAQAISVKYSIADIAGKKDISLLENLKTPAGRKIGRGGRASLVNLAMGMAKEERAVLSGVPGISPKIAAELLGNTGSLAAMLSLGVNGLASAEITQKNRKVRLGAARSERIITIMNHRAASGQIEAQPAADDSQAPPNADDGIDAVDDGIDAVNDDVDDVDDVDDGAVVVNNDDGVNNDTYQLTDDDIAELLG